MKRIAYYTFGMLSLALVPALGIAAELENPLGDADTPNEVIANVIRVSLGVIGGLVLLMLVYGGFLLLTSTGNRDKITRAKDTLMWAVIGLVIVFGSYGIADALFKALAGVSL